MTRDEFIKQRCEIDKITEEEFEEQYRVVKCNCGQPYCKGYRCLDLDNLLKENQELRKLKTYFIDDTGEKLEYTLDDYMTILDINIQQNEQICELKKQLENWKHHLKCSKEMLDLQGQEGNYNYDNYMLGCYNGMEYIISLFETREPNYKSGKDINFLHNDYKAQQQEFIKYLEDEIKELQKIKETELDCDILKDVIPQLLVCKDVLQKYKEIIGEETNESR